MTDENDSSLDLDAIEARANAATSEPWWIERRNGDDPVDHPLYVMAEDGELTLAAMFVRGIEGACENDAEFIAHARTDIPALIERIRELEAALGVCVDPWFSADDHNDEGSGCLEDEFCVACHRQEEQARVAARKLLGRS